jgi:Concanavalin A-like lectin/glucanases superfamily
MMCTIQSNAMQKVIVKSQSVTVVAKSIPDLVWYKFNSDIYNYKATDMPISDASPNGVAIYAISRKGLEYCYKFSGGSTSNYISLPALSRPRRVTFSCWLNVSSFSLNSKIFDYGDTFCLHIVDPKTLVLNNLYSVTYSTEFQNVWKHIVFTINGKKLVFYENGSEKLSVTMATILSDVTTSGRLGSSFAGGYNPTLYLSDFRIYDRVMNAKEIDTLYKS